MTEVQFLEIKPFVSCCRDLEVVYHIPSSIKASSKHYIALYEVQGSNQFTWVWAGKTIPIEQEGIIVKWRKGKVSFASRVLPKLSAGREYFLIYCNEDGTMLGQSRPFQFTTDADEFSSIDLQSAPSEDAVMISMHPKRQRLMSNSEVSLHNYNNDDDTMSFEVLSEQKYSDTTIQENIQLRTELVTLKETNLRLEDEVAMKDTNVEELRSEITTPKEELALHALSNSTVVINSLKKDEENRMYEKRIQDEIKKSTRLEELLDHKEAKMIKLESEINSFKAETRKMEHQLQMALQDINTLQIENRKLNDQIQKLQTEQTLPLDINPMQIENKKILDEVEKSKTELFLAEQQNISVELLPKSKIAEENIADCNIPMGGEYKTKPYIKLFKQDPFICHVCNKVLPAPKRKIAEENIADLNIPVGEEYSGKRKNSKEENIIIQYYGLLCKGVTDVASWSPYCVSKGLIPSDFSLKLQSIKSASEQVEMLLQYIIGPVQAGNVRVLYVLLDIMEQHGVSATKELATEIKDHLNANEGLRESTIIQRWSNMKRQLSRINDYQQRRCLEYKILEIENQMKQLKGAEYKAINNYVAKQDDEISFAEGDIIFSVPFKDAGNERMMGVLKGTEELGMFPLSYVCMLPT